MMDSGTNDNIRKNDIESIDFKKLRWLVSKNWIWFLALLLATNLSAYLYLRYTKPIFEATSEIKIDIESDASEFGIGMLSEEKNITVLSGEIELLKSRLLFQKLLDSLDLSVSYYTQGTILSDEKYHTSPIEIEFELKDNAWLDKKIFLNFKNNREFNYYLEGENESEFINVDESVTNEHIKFNVNVIEPGFDLSKEKFLFVLNSNEYLQQYLESNLNVKFLNLKANTLEISFQDHNPLKARDIVNTINSIYIKYTTEEKSRANNNKIQWIDGQLEKISSEMEDFESYFENFTISNRTSDLDGDLKKTIININLLDSQRFEISRRLFDVNRQLSELDEGHILTPSFILPNEIRSSSIKLNDLILQRQQLGLSYKESTYKIQEIDQEIINAKQFLSEELRQYENSLVSLQEELIIRRNALERAFIAIPGKTTELNKNRRFYKLYEEFYLTLMQSKAEFEIAIAGITPNFQILAPAKVSNFAVSPNKLIVQGTGAATGLLFCFIFISFKYLMEDKINSVEELEGLVPYLVIGTIPMSTVKINGSSLITKTHPKSGISEALRAARTNLQFISPEKGPQIITLTSSVSGEGKTFIASNLASIFAISGKKVCIVDLDLRKPSIATSLGMQNEDKGVSTILINKHSYKECIRNTDENLFYIPAGPIPPNPSELLLNKEFDNLLNDLQKEFDVIILDSPPIGLVTDGILAMKKSNLSILVTRYGYTRKRDIQNVIRTLKLSDSKVYVFFNGIESRKSYGYNYGYYSDNKSA